MSKTKTLNGRRKESASARYLAAGGLLFTVLAANFDVTQLGDPSVTRAVTKRLRERCTNLQALLHC